MRNIGAVILAAGGSTRFGEPKQLLEWHGESLIRRAVRAAREAGCAPVVVVIGATSERIATEVAESGATVALNPDWSRGLGTSIRCGMEHLVAELEAVVLLVCDQPFVDAAVVSALIARWENCGTSIVASRYANTLGVPAIFDRSCFVALRELPDDSGAKAIIQARRDEVAAFEFAAGAVDLDTPSDYARAQDS